MEEGVVAIADLAVTHAQLDVAGGRLEGFVSVTNPQVVQVPGRAESDQFEGSKRIPIGSGHTTRAIDDFANCVIIDAAKVGGPSLIRATIDTARELDARWRGVRAIGKFDATSSIQDNCTTQHDQIRHQKRRVPAEPKATDTSQNGIIDDRSVAWQAASTLNGGGFHWLLACLERL